MIPSAVALAALHESHRRRTDMYFVLAGRRIECGADKAGTFDTVLLDRAAELGGLGGLSVFIGDSPSDLAPLIAADLGIVVGRSPLIRRVCAAAGVQLRPLSAGASCGPALLF